MMDDIPFLTAFFFFFPFLKLVLWGYAHKERLLSMEQQILCVFLYRVCQVMYLWRYPFFQPMLLGVTHYCVEVYM